MLLPGYLFPFQVLRGGRVLRLLIGSLLMEFPGFRAHLTALVFTLMGKFIRNLVFPRLTLMSFHLGVYPLRCRFQDLSFLIGVVSPRNLEFLGPRKLSALVPLLPSAKHLFLLLFKQCLPFRRNLCRGIP